jgi:predicted nucleotidyltransferase
MLNLIEQSREQIIALCRRHGVKRLELFGSAASDGFDPGKSDIDFFYELDPAGDRGIADRFFDFQRDLQSLLGLPVDLVSARDASNPYFLEVANRHRLTLYAA